MPKEISKTNDNVIRYKLEPYSGSGTRHVCPDCRHKSSFARFIDITTGEYIEDDIGRCNREVECGYLKSPTKEDINGNLYVQKSKVKKEYQHLNGGAFNTIDAKYALLASIEVEETIFGKYLCSLFDDYKVFHILNRYHVGVGSTWGGATIFFQIDVDYRVRTGKEMLYGENGKRVKDPYNHINWVHTPDRDLKFGVGCDFNLKQCFFGEHLLNVLDTDTVHVVESEKTAIIASIISPDKLYVATGGLQNINEARLLPFKDKKLVFHPDKGKAFKLWEDKVEPFKGDYNIKVSNFLEDKDEVGEGDDLADYILVKGLK